MNLSRNLCKACIRRQQLFVSPIAVNALQTRSIFGDLFGGKKKTKSDEQKQIKAIDDSEAEPQLTEEEVMRMRDKSCLPALVKSELTLKNIPDLKYLWQYKHHFIRRRYAQYGRASGLKPGVMWPSKEELEWIKGYEKAFCKPLDQMLNEVREEKERVLERRRLREREVMSKLKQLPKMKKEFWDKYHRMHDEVSQEKAKKEKLIQEVREFVGYDLDPKDPRFEEALIKRDEESKRLSKALKKQEKQKQTLERLQALANEAMEREREDQAILDKSKAQTTDDKPIDDTESQKQK